MVIQIVKVRYNGDPAGKRKITYLSGGLRQKREALKVAWFIEYH